MSRPTSRTPGPRVLAPLLLAAAMASPAQAGASEQEPLSSRIGIGSRVRIQMEPSSGRSMVGTVRSMDATSITIETSGGATVRAPRNEIHSLQVSARRGRHTGRGAAIGALSGLLFGAVVGAGSGGTEFDPETGAIALSAVFTPVGALVGAIVGHHMQSDEWVDLPSMQSAGLSSPPVPLEDFFLKGPPAPSRALSPHPPEVHAVGDSLRFAAARVPLAGSNENAQYPPSAGALSWRVSPTLGRGGHGAAFQLRLTW